MKTRKFLPVIAVFVCFLCLISSVAAQTKKRAPVRKSTRSTSAAKTTAATAAKAAEIREAAEKVSTQIVNVTKFLYLLGGIARTIQDADAAARSGRTSPTNAKNKQAVITSLGNLRAGLAALEAEFQAKPNLLPFYSKIQGVADITANAEDQASAGQFVNSGQTLLQVVEKLSNTLVAMP